MSEIDQIMVQHRIPLLLIDLPCSNKGLGFPPLFHPSSRVHQNPRAIQYSHQGMIRLDQRHQVIQSLKLRQEGMQCLHAPVIQRVEENPG